MRQEIQGLRAVAVVLVVLFHLWPDRLSGGYVGVDVFFVISGFLITSHLVREVDRTGSVSLARFWARRLRRLLPASYLVLLVSAAGVVVWVPRVLWEQFLAEILAATLYVENWTLAINSVDYLAADNSPSPAQHYWTLSAEEQFYLLWPLLILGALWLVTRGRSGTSDRGVRSRQRRAAIFGVLAVTTGASLAYSLWVSATNPSLAYFVTPARAWEFGAGALLAFAPQVVGRFGVVLRALLGWVALVVLLGCSLVFDASTPMPGSAAVWVVAASATLIWVGAPAVPWASSRLLTLRPARHLGDISYAVYLWHWPLIILLPYVTLHPLTAVDKLSVLLATLGLSALTKRWVEDPVREARRFGLGRPRVTFACAVAGAVALAAVCVVPRIEVARDVKDSERAAARLVADAPPCFGAAARDPRAKDCPNPRLTDVLVPSPAAVEKDAPQYARCDALAVADPLQPCRFGERRPGTPHFAVIGDSHARLMMAMVEPLVDAGDVTVDMFVANRCPWSTQPPDTSNWVGQACAVFRPKLFEYLDQHAKEYDAVLTTARITTMPGTHEEQVAGLAAAWQRVAREGVPVVALRDNPQNDADMSSRANPNYCLASVPVEEANEQCALDRGARLDRWPRTLTEAARRTPGAQVIDLSHFYCDDESCPVVIGGVNVYFDNDHLTATYARTLAPFVYRELRKLGLVKA